MNQNETVLVTGGAGYIGSWVVSRLLGEGYRVISFDCLKFGGRSLLGVVGHPRFTFVRGDIRNAAEVKAVMKNVDYVAHLAALVGEAACKSEPEATKQINVEGTRIVTKTAVELGVRKIVCFSTCSSYGVQDTTRMANEQATLNPVSLYAETKIAGEKILFDACAGRDIAGTILRPSTVHGPSARMRFDLMVNHFVRDAFVTGKLTILGPDMWRPLMWVGDAGKAILAVFRAEPKLVRNEVFNLGGVEGNYRKREIGDIIKRDFLPKLDLVIGQSDPDLRSYRVDFTKIESKLGFKLSKTLQEAIGDLCQMHRDGIIDDPSSALYQNG